MLRAVFIFAQEESGSKEQWWFVWKMDGHWLRGRRGGVQTLTRRGTGRARVNADRRRVWTWKNTNEQSRFPPPTGTQLCDCTLHKHNIWGTQKSLPVVLSSKYETRISNRWHRKETDRRYSSAFHAQSSDKKCICVCIYCKCIAHYNKVYKINTECKSHSFNGPMYVSEHKALQETPKIFKA